MSQQLFITGNSSGLGRALSEALLAEGWSVYGCSRRGWQGEVHPRLRDVCCDLAALDRIPAALESLLDGVEKLDLLILNAGVLGKIRRMTDTPLADIQNLMTINAWSNKVILDWLYASGYLSGSKAIKQVVMLSSGASVLGNQGWSGYALSKATLNMLARLYANECPQTHFAAIAPGLIDSAMMDYLCVEPDPSDFPALQRIRDARGTETMPLPDQAARRVLDVLPELLNFESGSYVDIRQIIAPEEYTQLLNTASAARRTV